MKIMLLKKQILTVLFLFLIISAAACAGCLNEGEGDHDHDRDAEGDHDHDHDAEGDHDHDHDAEGIHDHDHDHGDPDASYVPPDPEKMKDVASGKAILAAVSVVPESEFVEKVGGDRVVVITMIPPGAGHTYDPSPVQLADLAKADIYFSLDSGEVFEDRYLETFRSSNPDMKIVSTSAGMDVKLKNGTADPHIWMSPAKAAVMVENICSGLISVDPENADYYTANKEAYLKELKELDDDMKASLAGKEGKAIIVYHPAWGHFTDEFGLRQIAIELDGKEPTAKSLASLIRTAREENVRVVFVQEQLSKTAAISISEETGAEVVTLDPLAKDYVSNMKKTAEIMAEYMD